MGRNRITEELGEDLTSRYKKSGMSVDDFMASINSAFDKQYKNKVGYASFQCMQVVHGIGRVFTFYYYEIYDQWFCKE